MLLHEEGCTRFHPDSRNIRGMTFGRIKALNDKEKAKGMKKVAIDSKSNRKHDNIRCDVKRECKGIQDIYTHIYKRYIYPKGTWYMERIKVVNAEISVEWGNKMK